MKQKKRKTIIIVMLTLITSVISVSIAFATFSTTLVIKEKVDQVDNKKWDVHFSKIPNGKSVGSVEGVVVGKPDSIKGDLTETGFTWSVNFNKPGDSVTYTFYVVNSGDFNIALVDTITPVVTCTSDGKSETKICSKVTYKVTHENGEDYKSGDIIKAGTSEKIVVFVKLSEDFNEEEKELLTSKIEVNAVQINMLFNQYVAPITK